MRKDFRASPTNLINPKGKLVSKSARAETFAEYLANQVWKAPSPEVFPDSPPLEAMRRVHLLWKNLTSYCAP